MTTDLVNRMAACENKPSNFLAPIALNGSAQQVSATDLFVTSVTFYGYKAVSATAVPTANANSTALGYTDYTGASGVAAGGPVFLDTIPGGSAVTEAPKVGEKFNLKDFWVLGTATDKILVGYQT